MVHRFLKAAFLESKKTELDNRAGAEGGREFSQNFSILFELDPESESRKNLSSWLEAVTHPTLGFELLANKEKEENESELDRMCASEGFPELAKLAWEIFQPDGILQPPIGSHSVFRWITQFMEESSEDKRAFLFWIYLLWVHSSLTYRSQGRDDKILNFMTKIKLENVKLVIVGQDPTHDKPSEGLAFHKVPCPSTRYILDHLRDEMELINHWEIKEKISGLNGPEMTMDSERLKISDAKLKRIKEECDLSGWIAQGVLPVNASLTYKGDTNVESPESKPWKPLMRWLLTYLYKREGAPHMVYILVGSEARKVMGDYPDMLPNHRVIRVRHPASGGQRAEHNDSSGVEWRHQLPFLNANYFLFQHRQEGREPEWIDWNQITEFQPNSGQSEMRKIELCKVFRAFQADATEPNRRRKNFNMNFGKLIVRVSKALDSLGQTACPCKGNIYRATGPSEKIWEDMFNPASASASGQSLASTEVSRTASNNLSVRPSSHKCSNCGEAGHNRRKCPKPQEQQE